MKAAPQYLFFVFFLLSQAAHAFINVESLRQSSKRGWHGSSSLKGNDSRGNTDASTIQFQSLNILKSPDSEFILALNYRYGEASREKNANRGNMHLRYAHSIYAQRTFGELFVQEEFNEFQLLKLRQVYGGGLRQALLDAKRTSLFLGVGGFYEDETLTDRIDQNTVRMNSYLSLKQALAENSSAFVIVYYQPNSRIVSDYRTRINFGFELRLAKSLLVSYEINWAQDTKPPEGVEKIDALNLVGLSLTY